jgi:serine/threonine protein kinase
MPRLSELGAILVGCRAVARHRWEEAVRAGAGDPARVVAALAEDPPDWWDGTPPAPPGLTDYQRGAIATRLAAGELPRLRRDLALNQFLLLDKLGEGGQGAVYRARQLNPSRFVAVKTLTRDTERGRVRFEQEARTLIRIRHPAVARFHLYERVRDEAGRPTDEYLIAMEFVDGTDLGRLLRAAGRVPWPFAARWAADLLGGLAEIHRHGFVHRDVKPENVMAVGPPPGPGARPEATAARLLDFGAVKAVGAAGEDGFEGGRLFVGTREYAPPEQWAGEAVPASDLYALGGTLFHVLTGRPPYRVQRRDPVAFRAAHVNEPVPDVGAASADVPAELGRLLRRMMAKSPAARGTAAELADEFRRLAPAPNGTPPRSATVPAPSPRPSVRPVSGREPRNPVVRAVEPALALLERLFIPGHRRAPPGEKPAVHERLVALLRRPPVLVVLVALIVFLVLWVR